jgi:hypothetical protein
MTVEVVLRHFHQSRYRSSPLSGRREPEPRGHVAAPELPRTGRMELGTRGHVAAPSREAGAIVLTCLYAGVPGPQGYRQ